MKPPTKEEVETYALTIDFKVNGERFLNYYEVRGWMIGKSHIKSWKACLKTWKMNSKEAQAKVEAESTAQTIIDKQEALMKSGKCPTCFGGKLETHDDGRIRCNQCNGDYTPIVKMKVV